MNDFKKNTVRDVMRSKIATVKGDDNLREALSVMSDSGYTCLLIEARDASEGIGILTQKDLVGAVFDFPEDLNDVSVAEVMTAPSVSVTPEYSVGSCVQMMRNLGVRRVPVVDAGKLVGIISMTDIFRRAAATLL